MRSRRRQAMSRVVPDKEEAGWASLCVPTLRSAPRRWWVLGLTGRSEPAAPRAAPRDAVVSILVSFAPGRGCPSTYGDAALTRNGPFRTAAYGPPWTL